jgi:hypothetical protein
VGILTTEQRKILVRFLVIGLGIPVVLCVMELIIYFATEQKDMRYATGTSWLIVAGLAVLSVACWAFFSQLLYRRLWDLLSHAPDSQDPWSFAEGAYGFVGVGISLSSVMGFFYYLINRDLAGSLCLYGLALILLGVELSRFLKRMDELEERIKEWHGDNQEL